MKIPGVEWSTKLATRANLNTVGPVATFDPFPIPMQYSSGEIMHAVKHMRVVMTFFGISVYTFFIRNQCVINWILQGRKKEETERALQNLRKKLAIFLRKIAKFKTSMKLLGH